MQIAELVKSASKATGTVLVEDYRGFRHLKARFDEDGPYVRTGKRGQNKERITTSQVIDKDLNLVAFKTDAEQ